MKLRDMKPWQKKRFVLSLMLIAAISIVYLATTTFLLLGDKYTANHQWSKYLTPSDEYTEKVKQLGDDATEVSVGTYVENVSKMSLRESCWTPTVLIWFRWDGNEDLDMAHNFRIYKGVINEKEIIKESHQNGENYQLIRCNVTLSKCFKAKRFPLESHQLRIYVESEIPVDQVVFKADKSQSGYNEDLEFSGYNIIAYDTAAVGMVYQSAHGDPEIKGGETNSELVTQFKINRSSWGVYIKCFIAMFGTLIWILIVLYINTYHRVDPIGMIPGALFGTVSNILVGANLLPDVLDSGLLEYMNVWGIMIILFAAFSVINVNRIRNKYENHDYAAAYGKMMFYLITLATVAGSVMLPLAAFQM